MDRIQPVEQQNQDVVNSDEVLVSEVNLNTLALKGYFGIENPTPAEEEKLNKLYELVTGDNVHEMSQVLLYLRQTENKLGIAPLGVARLDHVLNYLSVLGKVSELNVIRQSYET